MTSFPPSGFDWADGSGGIGTATASGQLNIRPDTGFVFEELSTSPQIELGEQATITHTFKCDYLTATILVKGWARGTVFVDSGGYETKVLTTTLTKQPGNMATVSMVAEGINFDNPPDEFEMDIVEINPEIERHPRYNSVLNYNTNATTGLAVDVTKLTGQQIINSAKNAANSSSIGSASESGTLLNSTSISTASVLTLAQELVTKYRKHIDTFYMPGFHIQWSQFFWYPPVTNGGIYREDPIQAGGLPASFWSSTGLPGGTNNLYGVINTFNQQIFDPNLTGNVQISWLRQADTVHFQRTWFKLTRSWIGGPLGQWDHEIYPVYDPNSI